MRKTYRVVTSDYNVRLFEVDSLKDLFDYIVEKGWDVIEIKEEEN